MVPWRSGIKVSHPSSGNKRLTYTHRKVSFLLLCALDIFSLISPLFQFLRNYHLSITYSDSSLIAFVCYCRSKGRHLSHIIPPPFGINCPPWPNGALVVRAKICKISFAFDLISLTISSLDTKAHQARCHLWGSSRAESLIAKTTEASSTCDHTRSMSFLQTVSQPPYWPILQIINLKRNLRNVALGKAFVLQGGMLHREISPKHED